MVKKNFIVLSFLIAFLFTCSLAYAINTADVNSDGERNIADIQQTGDSDGNLGTINQGIDNPGTAEDNFASIQQVGTGPSGDNLAQIDQEGKFNNAGIVQNGATDSNALITQTGTGSIAGDENNALIDQTGSNDNNNAGGGGAPDAVTITQEGKKNQAQITQTGDDNFFTNIDQDGEENQALLTQFGDDNDGQIEQDGNLNVADISQDDEDSFARINQEGDSNQALIGQTLDGNTATINQTGVGSNFATAVILQTEDGDATINQIGTTATTFPLGNQAYVSQDGQHVATVDQDGQENQALVQQGTAPADPFGAIPIAPGFDALPAVPSFPSL